MQRYTNPDVFFCPYYNVPGIANPKMHINDEYEYDILSSQQLTPLDGQTGEEDTPPSGPSSVASTRDESLEPPSPPQGWAMEFECDILPVMDIRECVDLTAEEVDKYNLINQWLVNASKCAEQQQGSSSTTGR